MLYGRRRRCSSTRSHALNITQNIWPALPSPQKFGPRKPHNVDQNWVAHHPVWSASTLHLHRQPFLEQQASFFACRTLPPSVGPHCWSESGSPSYCAVGFDAAPSKEPLPWKARPIFALPYPPPHSWALGNLPLSIKFGRPIMPCRRRRRCTSTGSPAVKNRPRFWPALPFPPISWAQGN